MNLNKLTRVTVLVTTALVFSCLGKTLPTEAPASSVPTASALAEVKKHSQAPASSASTLSEIKRIKDIPPAKRSKAELIRLRELSNKTKPQQVFGGRSPGQFQRVAKAQLDKFFAEKAALKAARAAATDVPESLADVNGTFDNHTAPDPAEPPPAEPSLAEADTQLADEDTPPSPAPLAKSQDTTGTGLVEIKAVETQGTSKLGDVYRKSYEAHLSAPPAEIDAQLKAQLKALAEQNVNDERRALKPAPKKKKLNPFVNKKFLLIAGMQNGADRGAFIGANDADPHHDWVKFTGWTPLLYKTNDFMEDAKFENRENLLPVDHLPPNWQTQRQQQDDWRVKLVRKESKWLKQPAVKYEFESEESNYQRISGLMRKFKLKQFLSPGINIDNPKMSFPHKDRANAAMADVVVGFRVDKEETGGGAEQTVNFAVFGKYGFVEQFAQGKLWGGPAQRARLLASLPDQRNAVEHNSICGKDPDDTPTCIMFTKDTSYQVLDFKKQPEEPELLQLVPKKTEWKEGLRNTTEEKVEEEVAKQLNKNKEEENVKKVLLGEDTHPQCALKPAIIFTLGLTNPAPKFHEESDTSVGCKLAQFLDAHSTEDKVLNVMVTGGSEEECKCQSRISKIFEIALTKEGCQDGSQKSVAETKPDPKKEDKCLEAAAAIATPKIANTPFGRGELKEALEREFREFRAQLNMSNMSKADANEVAEKYQEARYMYEKAAAEEEADQEEIKKIPYADPELQQKWEDEIEEVNVKKAKAKAEADAAAKLQAARQTIKAKKGGARQWLEDKKRAGAKILQWGSTLREGKN